MKRSGEIDGLEVQGFVFGTAHLTDELSELVSVANGGAHIGEVLAEPFLGLHIGQFETHLEHHEMVGDIVAEDLEELFQLGVFLGDFGLLFANEQLCADAGEQLCGTERFGEIISSAQFEALDDVVDLGFCGDEQDGDVTGMRLGFENPADFVAVHTRHHDIEEDEVDGMGFVAELERLFATGCDFEIVVGFEQAEEHIDIFGGVIDQQQAGSGFAGG